MKILLISDTHRKLNAARKVIQALPGFDLILHGGDYQEDAFTLSAETGLPVFSVKGNCDGCRTQDRQIVPTPAGKLLLTHGHLEGVKRDPTRLLYAAEEEGCIAVCFGHTHMPICVDMDGIWLINPGSLTNPRGGSTASFAMLTCETESFHAEIIPLEDLETVAERERERQAQRERERQAQADSKPKPKAKGGFLRRLLNYSDRF